MIDSQTGWFFVHASVKVIPVLGGKVLLGLNPRGGLGATRRLAGQGRLIASRDSSARVERRGKFGDSPRYPSRCVSSKRSESGKSGCDYRIWGHRVIE